MDPRTGAHKTADYWENVCSGITWLAHQVSNRQEHLYIAAEIAAGRLQLLEPE